MSAVLCVVVAGNAAETVVWVEFGISPTVNSVIVTDADAEVVHEAVALLLLVSKRVSVIRSEVATTVRVRAEVVVVAPVVKLMDASEQMECIGRIPVPPVNTHPRSPSSSQNAVSITSNRAEQVIETMAWTKRVSVINP